MMVTPRVHEVPHQGCSPHAPVAWIHWVTVEDETGPPVAIRYVASEREARDTEREFAPLGEFVRRSRMSLNSCLASRSFREEIEDAGIRPACHVSAREACAVLNKRPRCR